MKRFNVGNKESYAIKNSTPFAFAFAFAVAFAFVLHAIIHSYAPSHPLPTQYYSILLSTSIP